MLYKYRIMAGYGLAIGYPQVKVSCWLRGGGLPFNKFITCLLEAHHWGMYYDNTGSIATHLPKPRSGGCSGDSNGDNSSMRHGTAADQLLLDLQRRLPKDNS